MTLLAQRGQLSRPFANDFPVDHSRLSSALLLFSGADTKFFLRANVNSISLVMPLGSLVYGLECSNWTSEWSPLRPERGQVIGPCYVELRVHLRSSRSLLIQSHQQSLSDELQGPAIFYVVGEEARLGSRVVGSFPAAPPGD